MSRHACGRNPHKVLVFLMSQPHINDACEEMRQFFDENRLSPRLIRPRESAVLGWCRSRTDAPPPRLRLNQVLWASEGIKHCLVKPKDASCSFWEMRSRAPIYWAVLKRNSLKSRLSNDWGPYVTENTLVGYQRDQQC